MLVVVGRGVDAASDLLAMTAIVRGVKVHPIVDLDRRPAAQADPIAPEVLAAQADTMAFEVLVAQAALMVLEA